MTTQIAPFGPFAAVYAGSAAGSGALELVSEKRTEGSILKYVVPEKYIPILNTSIQSGLATLTFSVTFIGAGEIASKLAMGNKIETGQANIDGGSQFEEYAILLLDADPDSSDSFYIPRCYTLKDMTINRKKTEVLRLPVSFIAQNRNRFIQLFHRGTHAEIADEMGSRSPF